MIEGVCLAVILGVLLAAVTLALSSTSRSADEVITSDDVALAFTPPTSYVQDGFEVMVEHRPEKATAATLLLPAPCSTGTDAVKFHFNEHLTFKLAGAKSYQAAIAQCNLETPVHLGAVPLDGGPIEVIPDGPGRVGVITAGHAVAKALRAGDRVLHVSISSCSLPEPRNGGLLCLRVLIGEMGAERFPLKLGPLPATQAAAPAKQRLAPANPPDEQAKSAFDSSDHTIGCIDRDRSCNPASPRLELMTRSARRRRRSAAGASRRRARPHAPLLRESRHPRPMHKASRPFSTPTDNGN